MTDNFNPYQTWLGLAPELTAPNYYQLLGLTEGESDPAKIGAAADRAATKVRAFRPGDKAAAWAGLLDEIKSARQCLMDVGKRAAYDRQLQSGDASPGAPAPRAFHRPAPRGAVPAETVSPEPEPEVSDPTQPRALPMKAKTPPPTENAPTPQAPQPAAPETPQYPGDAAAYGYPGQAAPMPGYPMPGNPAQGYPAQGYPAQGYPAQGYPAQGYPAQGYPGQGYPMPGSPAPGYPVPGPMPQQPMPGGYPQQTPMPQQPTQASTPQAQTPSVAQPVPAQPTPVAGSRPQPRSASATGSSSVPVGVAVPASTADSSAAGVSVGGGGKASTRAKRRKKGSNMLPIIAASIGGLILLTAVALMALLMGGDNDQGDDTSPSSTAPVVDNRPPVVTERPPVRQRPRTTITQKDGFKTPAGELPDVSSDVSSTPFDSDEGQNIPIPGLEGSGSVDSGTDGGENIANTTPGMDSPDGIEGGAGGEAPDVAPDAGDAQTPPEDEPPAVEPSEEEVANLSAAMTAARAALANNEFDEADSELKALESLPMRVDDRDKFHRLQLLAQYARSFRQALEDAIKNFSGGDNISVGASTVVGFVEAKGDTITIRVAGSNRDYEIGQLPEGLALAIVDTLLDQEDPVNMVTKAAYLATLENPRADRVQKARDWFAEASEKGVDIEDFAQVLDDKYDAQ